MIINLQHVPSDPSIDNYYPCTCSVLGREKNEIRNDRGSRHRPILHGSALVASHGKRRCSHASDALLNNFLRPGGAARHKSSGNAELTCQSRLVNFFCRHQRRRQAPLVLATPRAARRHQRATPPRPQHAAPRPPSAKACAAELRPAPGPVPPLPSPRTSPWPPPEGAPFRGAYTQGHWPQQPLPPPPFHPVALLRPAAAQLHALLGPPPPGPPPGPPMLQRPPMPQRPGQSMAMSNLAARPPTQNPVMGGLAQVKSFARGGYVRFGV